MTQHVLITGGTGGLGLGVTPAVLNEGAYVMLAVREAASVERLKGRLSPNAQTRLRWQVCDLLQEAAVEELVDSMDRLDAVVHLVGGFSMGPTATYGLSQWQADFDLNLTTTFLVCKYALRRMQATGYGRIVTLGSRGAVQPGGQLASYCASKAGVVALTQAIAAETQGTDITANCILPSIIDTSANRAAMGNNASWVSPEDIAGLVTYLISPAARSLRGAVIPMYGNA